MKAAVIVGTAPAFQFYASDWVMGTLTLSAEEEGVYLRCILYQWVSGGIPADSPSELARVMRVSEADGQRIWTSLSKKFQRCEDGLWRNVRLEDERKKQADYRAAKAESGKAGGKAKAEKSSKPDEPASSSLGVRQDFATSESLANPSSSSSSSSSVPTLKNNVGERPPKPKRDGIFAGSGKWGEQHASHVDGFCDWMCFPREDFAQYANRLGSEQELMAWAKALKADKKIIPTGRPWDFWREQFTEHVKAIKAQEDSPYITLAEFDQQQKARWKADGYDPDSKAS